MENLVVEDVDGPAGALRVRRLAAAGSLAEAGFIRTESATELYLTNYPYGSASPASSETGGSMSAAHSNGKRIITMTILYLTPEMCSQRFVRV
ncbi:MULTISPECIES: hypothetical protein [unclassified Nocardia]|uniref:hypothetical protein n=1 Tax=unclassified Nocardia TaxID=2637762 RepID=UPI001CE4423C|nr:MULTISPECIES: hypothetical protein [unclassified Nocardia]